MYFIKKELIAVSKSRPSECLITGDLSAKIIDQLSSLVDEVSIQQKLLSPESLFQDSSTFGVQRRQLPPVAGSRFERCAQAHAQPQEYGLSGQRPGERSHRPADARGSGKGVRGGEDADADQRRSLRFVLEKRHRRDSHQMVSPDQRRLG